MGKCTLLMNASAGKFHRTTTPQEMELTLQKLDLHAQVVGTTSEEHFVRELCRLVAAKEPRVAVAGGDGTVRLAAQHLAHTDTSLVIVPQGTMNNFAAALRLPLDLPTALRLLEEGDVREVDLGRVRDRYFTESAGVGIFANALAIYGRQNKNIVRGIYALLRILLFNRSSRIAATVDGKRIVERSAMCIAANTYRFAQALPIAPGAKLNDGQLDVAILGDLRGSELIRYWTAIRRQTHLALDGTKLLRGSRIRIESPHPVLAYADDDLIGRTPIEITCDPHALKIVSDAV